MIKINGVIGILIAMLFIPGCNKSDDLGEQPKTIVLKGATLFDGTRQSVDNSVILVKDGIIQAVGDDDIIIPSGSDLIDVTGKYITPGLVDAHIHFCQTGFFDARPDAADLRDSISYQDVQAYQKDHPDRYYKAYLYSGVTAVYDVGSFPWTIKLGESAEFNPEAPHIAAAGALLTPAPEQMISIFNTPSETVMVHLGSVEIGRKVVRQNSDLGSTGIKVWGILPQDSTFMERLHAVADEIDKTGNKMIVHATTLDEAKAALRNHAKLLVHSVRDKILDDEFIALIKNNQAIYTPTLVVEHGYLHAYRALNGDDFLYNDPNEVVDAKTREIVERAGEFRKFIDQEVIQKRYDMLKMIQATQDSVMAINLRTLFEAGGLIAVGTDAGNPGTLHGISIFDELEAMQNAGIPAEDLITMATRNGAMAMEREADIGTIETGKIADLIILDRNPAEDISNMRSITHVMRGGLLKSVIRKEE